MTSPIASGKPGQVRSSGPDTEDSGATATSTSTSTSIEPEPVSAEPVSAEPVSAEPVSAEAVSAEAAGPAPSEPVSAGPEAARPATGIRWADPDGAPSAPESGSGSTATPGSPQIDTPSRTPSEAEFPGESPGPGRRRRRHSALRIALHPAPP